MKYRDDPNFDYGKVSDFSMGARYMCKFVVDLSDQVKKLRNGKKGNHTRNKTVVYQTNPASPSQ